MTASARSRLVLNFNPFSNLSSDLQVGWVLVALIGSRLELLEDPALQLVGVTLEVLVAARVLQESLAVAAGLLEGGIARQDLVTALLDVLRGLQDLDLPRLGLPRPWGVVGSHVRLGLRTDTEKRLSQD